MNIHTDTMISMTEANQDFSKVMQLVDENGSAIILKDNAQLGHNGTLSDAEVFAVSRELMKQNRVAYEVLAK